MTITHLPLPAELPATAMSSVGSYPTHAAAQQAVDYLSDHDFPVEHATIVGTDLRLVEDVTGRIVATEHAEHANRLLTQHAEIQQYTWHSR